MSDKTYAERFGTPSRPDGCPVLIAAALTKVETENAALRADKERLDSGTILLTVNGERVHHVGVNLRAAIDAARKEAQP